MTGDGGGEGNKAQLTINIGKEIDAALGDALRGLFVKPASALGDLASDALGILGDRIKMRRELNLRLGMDEVRRKLEANNVDIDHIASPKEEELHLLVTGMSLAGDADLRDLWAGLFAKVLEPSSDITAERPFLSVLGSLSPLDAKVIDFLAFGMRTDNELRAASKSFMPKDPTKVTPEKRAEIDEIRKSNAELRDNAVRVIKSRALDSGLTADLGPGWSENLLRQGVIELTPLRQTHVGNLRIDKLDERGIIRAFDHLNRQLGNLEQTSKRRVSKPGTLFSKPNFGDQIDLEVQLTGFGKRFVEACGLL
ncbi:MULTISPECIES: Abi-alpha family protein [unclassified Ensifer]|uniref:Abi-alpha family protein n=1 Tax=unclassified Ensifer TaxID=2633371 RepID=UPI00071044E6|nr:MULTISPECIES: Abi-alpha family protein [unclassified Ensifer]KQW47198.1 hypothetical protein ASD02_34400 [Ensifer sp. Root1252]KRC68750.1 hypothetical protein ASE32_35230 [Ensifer sp. Root231]KRC93916.1 hypothetical protein ASE47_34895 [Ensifer sp. Root258]